MKRMMPIAAIVALTGCGGSILLPQRPYVAANTVSTPGSIRIGDVVYVPAESGMLTPTQVFHSSGRYVVNMPESIVDWTRHGLTAELEKSGLRLDTDARLVLGCRVTRIGIDQFPFSVETTFAGDPSLYRAGDTVALVKMAFDLKRHHNVGTNLSTIRKDMDDMLAEAYAKFVSREDVRPLLGPPR